MTSVARIAFIMISLILFRCNAFSSGLLVFCGCHVCVPFFDSRLRDSILCKMDIVSSSLPGLARRLALESLL